jgi:hypothetical protein
VPFRWDLRFFGLTPESKEQILLEPFFLLGYYFGMTWQDYYSLPVSYKSWLIQRIKKEIERGSDKGNELTKAANDKFLKENCVLIKGKYYYKSEFDKVFSKIVSKITKNG